MADKLRKFFTSGISNVFHLSAVRVCIERLRFLRDVFFNVQKRVKLYSSSILFLYEGDTNDDAEPFVDVKMIDFANVYDIDDGELDVGYILGLNNLSLVLENIYEMR